MSPDPNGDTLLNPGTWTGVGRLVAGSVLFWAVTAGLLFLSAPSLGSPGRLLVFTECVGMVFVGCIVLLGRLRLLSRTRPLLRWLITGSIAIPVGYFVGHVIAFLMLGEPVDHLASHGDDYMVPIVLDLLVAGFVLYYAATREQLAREAAARSDAQRLAVESQLRLLRAQLEPHMLFNTLANLRSLLKEDTHRAELMIDQLITYLRSALAASRTESASLSHEFTQLRAYLEIMSLRMGPRLAYRLELPAALERTPVPPMLLQPLVENAIKHGLEPKVGAGSIEVIARATDAGVEISVVDSGLGLSPEYDLGTATEAKSGSYGLRHVRERLEAVYGPRASLTLAANEPQGTRATVRIPR